MAAGGARRGRRDNGLDAADYAVAGDVDPRVGEHLLDVLAAGGIAAYLLPASDLNPVTRTTTFPARPTDRLFVDRAHLATARRYLTRLAADERGAASGNAPDIEAEWARIVAGFHTEVDPDKRSWPASEDLAAPPAEPDQEGHPDRHGGTRRGGSADLDGPTDAGRLVERFRRPPATPPPVPPITPPDEPSLLDALDTFGVGLPEDPTDDEGYTPPPPPPLPQFSKYAMAGVLGVVIGFVLFLFPSLISIDPDVVMLFGFTCILAGFITLVWRLRPGDEEDDDNPDNGAVV